MHVDRRENESPDTPNHELLLSRRHFLYGALGVGALALASTGLDASPAFADDEEEFSYLSVPEEAVFTLEDCTKIEPEGNVALIANLELPYGTLLFSNSNVIAACLLPTESSNPLTQVGILYLNSGYYITVLDGAVNRSEGYEIYDVRANELGLIWTESNILSGIWRVYTATFDGETIGEPLMVDEGNSDWETPTLAAVGNHALWQVLPVVGGPYSSDYSLLKRAVFGKDTAETIYSSLGRMCTMPYPLSSSVVITPRTNTGAVHHQLTLIDVPTGEVKDSLVLPSNMKPLEAGYGDTGFTFSFPDPYNYGAGISKLGTYTVASKHSAYDYVDKTWFRFGRSPSAAPSWCSGLFIVKSTSSVCGVDLENHTYFVLDVEDGSDTYGDYLASTGVNENFVTYSNVHSTSIDGAESKYCRVRVWARVVPEPEEPEEPEDEGTPEEGSSGEPA